MPRRITQTTLNASTQDILNVIRQNATYEYQQAVPEVQNPQIDIPKVGEVLYGTPALANQFLNALINRIALVRANSAVFNNPYSRLKKGMIEYGETVEEIFVDIAKVVTYDPEKAAGREFRRTFPEVKSAFHVINWRTMYPITIQDEDLKQAFTSIDGVQELIAKIVDSIYTAAEYDEFLLFKYLLIKGVTSGKMYPIGIDDTDMNNTAIAFRGASNTLPFMKSEYNVSGVLTTTPKSRQVIFMDAMFNARYDVDVLARAFNMDKATFMGSLYLIDDWTTFDNHRFAQIMENSDGLAPVTAEELALMSGVKAILLDENWFQVFDNKNQFTEKYVASGLYWNYFYHTWKTISMSPFSNAIVFVDANANIAYPMALNVRIATKDVSPEAVTLAFDVDETRGLYPQNVEFEQNLNCTENMVGIQPYGAMIVPPQSFDTPVLISAHIGNADYRSTEAITASTIQVGDTFTMALVSD